MTSLNKKNLSAWFHILKNSLHHPVNVLFYIGLLVIAVAVLILFFENLAWDSLVFVLFVLGFGYWGYQHEQVDRLKSSEQVSQYWWEVLIALLGLITLFGIYLALAVALKYDFQVVLQYIGIRFMLLLAAYTLGHCGSYCKSAN